MVTMPTLKFVQSPNYSQRDGETIRLVVVHDCEGGYAGSVAWFAQTRSQVSAHFVMREDGGEVTQMVDMNKKAWHCCSYNSCSIGIEGAGVAAHGFSDAWWTTMANMVAWLCHRYAIYPRWAQGGEGAGFASHHDLGAMGGGHTDVGPVGSPEWMRFIGLVNDAYAAMESGPLPSWAPIGALPPAAISAAPNATPEPSHGGAIRHDLTPPNVDWVQMTLNALHVPYIALKVDDDLGTLTREAVARFQGQRGLFVDGIPGDQTIAALQKAIGSQA